MLELLAAEKLTLTMLAERLGTIPANLSRHLRTLEGAGLAVLAEKRETARNIEKYYTASAASYRVDPGLGGAARARGALSLLGESLADARAAGGDALAFLLALRLGPESKAELQAKLRALVEEYEGKDEAGGEGLALNIALYGSDLVRGRSIEI